MKYAIRPCLQRIPFAIASALLCLSTPADRELRAVEPPLSPAGADTRKASLDTILRLLPPDRTNNGRVSYLDETFKDFEQVNLKIEVEGESAVTAPLREERTEDGRVIVSFWTNRDQVDKLELSIDVPGGPGGVAGGTRYELSVDDFVN